MIKKALIIASDDNGLQKVYGIPAVQRLIALALQAGLKVHIVGNLENYLSILSDYDHQLNFQSLKNAEELKEALKGLQSAEEDVMILKANHVIDRKGFNFFIEMAKDSDLYIMESQGHGYAEPVCSAHAKSVSALAESIYSGVEPPQELLSRARLIQNFLCAPYLMGEGECRSRAAEKHLMNSLSAQTSQTDGFMSRYFDRYISRFISRIILKTPLTPNMVTMIGVSIGFLGAYMLAQPAYITQLTGALLFVLCIIFDGVDGEVARLKLKESRFGHYFDIITDNIVHIAVFIAIAVGLYRRADNLLYIHMLWVLLIGFAFCAVSVYFCILCKKEEELKKRPLLMRIMALLTNRDFAYIVLLFSVFDKLNWFFIGTAFGTYLFAAGLWGFDYYEKSSKKATDHKAGA